MRAFIVVLAALVGGSVFAEVPQRPLITCVFEGQDLKNYRNHVFPENAVAGELVLVEYRDENPYKPKRLAIRKYYYTKFGNTNAVVRHGVSGAPFTRIGYSIFEVGGKKIHAFNYNQYDYSTSPSFQIQTDGETSVIGYSQDGTSRRGFQHSLQCEIHAETQVEPVEIDFDSLNKEEKIATIKGLEWEKGIRHDNLNVIANWDEVKAALVKRINEFDFAKEIAGTEEYNWPTEEGCGDLKLRYSWRPVVEVTDYAGKTLGFTLRILQCTNKLEYKYVRYNEITGEPTTHTKTKEPQISDIILDAEFNILQEGAIRAY